MEMEQLEKRCWTRWQPRSPLHQHLKMKTRENEPRQAFTLPALNPGSFCEGLACQGCHHFLSDHVSHFSFCEQPKYFWKHTATHELCWSSGYKCPISSS